MNSLGYNAPPSLLFSFSSPPARSDQDNSASQISADIDRVVQAYWKSKASTEKFFCDHLDDLFHLRIRAINYSLQKPALLHIDVLSLLDREISQQALRSEALQVLHENMRFALRVVNRSAARLLGDKRPARAPEEPIPVIDFSKWVTILAYSNVDVQPLIDLLSASLRIEMALLCIGAPTHAAPFVNAERLLDLAQFVARAGQEYGAVVLEMTEKTAPPPVVEFEEESIPADVLEENRLLAELDIETLAAL